jgi:hypothetical protein
MAASVERLLIFLASPGDVLSERRCAQQVVDELNRTLPDEKALALQLIRWEEDAYPGYGCDAQAVVNAQLAEMAKYTLFVGILWNRLGTETSRADSGTVEEFRRAVQASRETGQPEIWFYFRESPVKLDTPEQVDQRSKVIKFREEIKSHGLPWSYKSPADFKNKFRIHLTKWLNSWRSVRSQAPQQASADKTAEQHCLAITLDPDYEFIGGEEGGRTAAYRILKALNEGNSTAVELRCEALPMAEGIAHGLESLPQRTLEEERRLRHALKIQDHCKKGGQLFEQALDFVLLHSQFKKDSVLVDESGLGEFIVGLRDAIFGYGPVLPGRNTTAPWLLAANQRSQRLFAWHEDYPDNYLVVGFTEEDVASLAACFKEWMGFSFSDTAACHAFGLGMGGLQKALVPAIAVDSVKRYNAAERERLVELSHLRRWLVGHSYPQRAYNRLTWTEMERLQSRK